jgi:DnaK suppressor protein
MARSLHSTIAVSGAVVGFHVASPHERMALCERLIEERDRLEQRLAALTLEARPEGCELAIRADPAARDRRLLDEVNRAIDKFHTGTYGFCEGTGEPIALPRLHARPWARYGAGYRDNRARPGRAGGWK